jgi:hypothetical protein
MWYFACVKGEEAGKNRHDQGGVRNKIKTGQYEEVEADGTGHERVPE